MFPLADFLEVRQGIFTVGEVFEREQQVGLANADVVVVGQGGFIVNFYAVNEHAVFAAHVDCIVLVLALVEANLHVLAGNVGVDNLDGNGLIPADYVRPVAEGVIVALVGSGDYKLEKPLQLLPKTLTQIAIPV